MGQLGEPMLLERLAFSGEEPVAAAALYAPMPRYYMHICNGNGFVEDEEGRELLDEASARQEAIVAARDVMANDLRDGELDLSSFIEVEDQDRQLLFTIHFIDAVKLISRHTGEADRSRRP